MRILVGGERALTARFAALASHYLRGAVLLPARRGPRQGRRRRPRQGAAPASARADSAGGRRSAAINATLLARMDARLETGRDLRRPDHRRALCRGARGTSDPRRRPLSRRPRRSRRVSPRALVRLEGAVYSVPCRWAGLDLIARIGATTRHDRRARRDARSRIRASALGSGRSTTVTICRSWRGSRRRCAKCCPSLLRDLGAPFPAVWDHFHAAHAPARGGPALRQGARAARHAGRRGRRAGAGRRAPPRHAAAARADAGSGRRPDALASEADPAPRCATSRCASGCAADYDGWLAEARMSAAAITRDLVVTHTRALKLPGRRARVREPRAASARAALAARRLPARGPQRRAGLAPRVGHAPAAARGALSPR